MNTGVKLAAVLFGMAGMAGMSASALAERGMTLRRPGAGEGQAMAPARMGARRAVGRPGARFRRRKHAARRLLNTGEGKALREEFKKKVEALRNEHKTLHEKIRAELQGDKPPREVLDGYRDDFKALAKKRALLHIEFRESLLALARKNLDKMIEERHKRFREMAEKHRARLDAMKKRRAEMLERRQKPPQANGE